MNTIPNNHPWFIIPKLKQLNYVQKAEACAEPTNGFFYNSTETISVKQGPPMPDTAVGMFVLAAKCQF